MKNKKNGFTLIELLAVIIVLAIIALIATPIIFNVIENAKLKSLENSCYGEITMNLLVSIQIIVEQINQCYLIIW